MKLEKLISKLAKEEQSLIIHKLIKRIIHTHNKNNIQFMETS